jgi:hypothetical protein
MGELQERQLSCAPCGWYVPFLQGLHRIPAAGHLDPSGMGKTTDAKERQLAIGKKHVKNSQTSKG